MGDSLILYFLIWVNVKQLRLQLNYPDVKLPSCAPHLTHCSSPQASRRHLSSGCCRGKATTWCPRRTVWATNSTPAPAPTSPSLPASPARPCSPPAGERSPWNIGGRCEFWSDKWSCVSLGMTGDRVTAGVLLRELVQLLLIEWHSDRVSYQDPAFGKKKIQTLKLRVKVTSYQRIILCSYWMAWDVGKDQFNVLSLFDLVCLAIAHMQVLSRMHF